MVFKSGHVYQADPRDPWHLTQKGPWRPVPQGCGSQASPPRQTLGQSNQVAPGLPPPFREVSPHPPASAMWSRPAFPTSTSSGRDFVRPPHPEQQPCLTPKAPPCSAYPPSGQEDSDSWLLVGTWDGGSLQSRHHNKKRAEHTGNQVSPDSLRNVKSQTAALKLERRPAGAVNQNLLERNPPGAQAAGQRAAWAAILGLKAW